MSAAKKVVRIMRFAFVILLFLLVGFFSLDISFGQSASEEPSQAPDTKSNSIAESQSNSPEANPPAAEPQDAAPALEANSAEPEVKKNDEIQMIRGDLEAIHVYSLSRISVTNPDVADIANVDSNQILMLAKRAGVTTLFIWDQYGKRSVTIRVFEEDLSLVEKRLQEVLDRRGLDLVIVEANPDEGKVIVSGQVPVEMKSAFAQALEPFGSVVMNLAEERTNEDLVQIDVQIAELNTSITSSIGLDWTAVSGNSALTYVEDSGSFVTTPKRDIFKVGPLSRTSAIMATVNLLLSEGKGRILSKPKLLVVNGKEASFQVGGQIPISTTTTSTGGNVEQNITFKDYGITMTVTPTIQGGKVSLVVSVEVSDIDAANAQNGVVAFTTRNAQTQLLLDDNQTVVLAGLIKQSDDVTVKKVPFFGDIPLVGLAFRSTSTSPKETELVISLTPKVIPQSEPEEVEESEDEETEEAAKLATPKAGAGGAAAADSAEAGTETKEEAPTTESAPMDEQPAVSEAPATVSTEAEVPVAPAEDTAEEKNSIPQDMMSYVQGIQKKIAEAITYPYEAKEKGWEGTVKLWLHVLRDGTLKEISVKESSGYDIFDKDAVNTAQILAPYDPFPSDSSLEELLVTLPIVYTQKPVSSQGGISIPNLEPGQQEARIFVPDGISYAETIQKRIADSVIYPEEAQERGWEGTVKLNLRILRDGTLAYAGVQESSGYDIIDECALKTAKSLAPYSAFPSPAEEEEVSLTVPIVYSLKQSY